MNILDIILIAILALTFISGMKKGFLASLLSMVAFIGSWIGARSIYMNLTQQFMTSSLRVSLANLINASDIVEGSGLGNELMRTVSANESWMSQITARFNGQVPDAIANAFRTHAGDPQFASLTLTDYLNQTIWQSIFNLIGFVLVFAVCYAVLSLIINLLNHTFEFPALRGIDALSGGVLALVRGYILVCFLMVVVPMIFMGIGSTMFNELVGASKVAAFFADTHNSLHDVFGVEGIVNEIVQMLPPVV